MTTALWITIVLALIIHVTMPSVWSVIAVTASIVGLSIQGR